MTLFICQYCGNERKNIRSLRSHQVFCKQNPQRSQHDHAAAGAKSSRQTHHDNKANNIEKYYLNPSLCITCNAILPYEKRHGMYCNKSCSAKTNNVKRIRKKTKTRSLKQNVLNLFNIKHTCYKIKCSVCGKYFWADKRRKTCSHECRAEIWRQRAIDNPKMGGNKNNKAYGWYTSKYAGKVWLESTWELKVAESLDDNCIRWIRPSYLPYNDKRYYPDFYLTDYNIYLDPKNEYLQEQDRNKIQQVQLQNNVVVLVLGRCDLKWDKIYSIINAL